MLITNIDEIDKDMLLRQSRILYPEVEDWLLNLAIEAYENSLKSTVIEEEPMIEITKKYSPIFLYILIEYGDEVYKTEDR